MGSEIWEQLEEALSEWIEALSFHELSTNEDLLRAFESFEKNAFSHVK